MLNLEIDSLEEVSRSIGSDNGFIIGEAGWSTGAVTGCVIPSPDLCPGWSSHWMCDFLS